jgi:Coenzyme PQQ synthesis protein D (PqqD)
MIWPRRKKLQNHHLMSEPSTRAEAFAYCPVKNRQVLEEELEGGALVLTYPLVIRPWLAGVAQRLGLQSGEPLTRKLQLDEMGSLTWSLLDGKRTVQDVVDFLCRRYKLNRREAEVATTGFLRQLGKRGLIGLRSPPKEDREKST